MMNPPMKRVPEVARAAPATAYWRTTSAVLSLGRSTSATAAHTHSAQLSERHALVRDGFRSSEKRGRQ
jgi:hypothetical protein